MWYQRHWLAVLLVLFIVAIGCRRSQPTPHSSVSLLQAPSTKRGAIEVDGSSVQAVRDSDQGEKADRRRRLMPSQTEICNSDVLLLSVYEFDALYGSPLPKACCSKAIKLKAAWQCEHDWPSSDVPSCSSLGAIADRLTALLDEQPQWYTPVHRRRAIVNVGRLRSLVQSKDGCMP